MPKLIVTQSDGERIEVDLTGDSSLVLGRSPSSDVVIARRMASREHATIEGRDGRYFVIDRDSYNGTFVNQRPVREAELHHGDEIRVASYTMRFVDGELHSADFEETVRVARPTLGRADETDPLLQALPDPVDSEAATPVIPLEPVSPPDALTEPELQAPDFDADLIALAESQVARRPVKGQERPRKRRPAGEPRPSLAADWRVWLLGALFVLISGAVLLRMPASGAGAPPKTDAPAPAPQKATARTALDAALAVVPADRDARLWQFVAEYPSSPLREEAFVQLIAGGATRSLVCDHASQNAPELFYEGGELKDLCTPP